MKIPFWYRYVDRSCKQGIDKQGFLIIADKALLDFVGRVDQSILEEILTQNDIIRYDGTAIKPDIQFRNPGIVDSDFPGYGVHHLPRYFSTVGCGGLQHIPSGRCWLPPSVDPQAVHVWSSDNCSSAVMRSTLLQAFLVYAEAVDRCYFIKKTDSTTSCSNQ